MNLRTAIVSPHRRTLRQGAAHGKAHQKSSRDDTGTRAALR